MVLGPAACTKLHIVNEVLLEHNSFTYCLGNRGVVTETVRPAKPKKSTVLPGTSQKIFQHLV